MFECHASHTQRALCVALLEATLHCFSLTFRLRGVGCQAQGQFLPLRFPASHLQLSESYFPSWVCHCHRACEGLGSGLALKSPQETRLQSYSCSVNPLVVNNSQLTTSPRSKKVASETPLTLQKQPEDTGEGTAGLCEEQGCPEELPSDL